MELCCLVLPICWSLLQLLYRNLNSQRTSTNKFPLLTYRDKSQYGFKVQVIRQKYCFHNTNLGSFMLLKLIILSFWPNKEQLLIFLISINQTILPWKKMILSKICIQLSKTITVSVHHRTKKNQIKIKKLQISKITSLNSIFIKQSTLLVSIHSTNNVGATYVKITIGHISITCQT